MGNSIDRFLQSQTPSSKPVGGNSIDSYLSSPKAVQTEPIHSDQVDDLSTHTGNLLSFIKSSITANSNVKTLGNDTDPSDNGNILIGTAKQLYKNIFGDNGSSPQVDPNQTPGQNVLTQMKARSQMPTSQATNMMSDPSGTLSGMAKGMEDQLSSAVGAVTITTNDYGTAIPATPQQEAQNLQSLAGTVAQFAVFKGVRSAMEPASASEALALSQSSRVGKIVSNLNSDVAAASLSGATQASIENMGSKQQPEAIIAAGISYLPIGVAFGLLGGTNQKMIDSKVNKLVIEPHLESIAELAALNDIRKTSTSQASVDKLALGIDVVSTSDNLVEAALKNRLANNDGFVVHGLSQDKLFSLLDKVETSDFKEAPDYKSVPGLDESPATFGPAATPVTFESPLDKLAYKLQNTKKTTKAYKSYMDDFIKQTGESPEGIISHGKYVASKIQEAQQNLTPRSQPEIDQINRAAQVRGQGLIENSQEGQPIQDATGRQWTKNGDVITDGKVTYPVTSQEAHLTLGRSAEDLANTQPFIQLPQQQYNPSFGRTTHSNVKAYVGPDDITLITKLELNNYGRTFFEQTGHLPGEIVSYGGVDHIVTGMGGGELTIKDAVTGTVKHVDPITALRTTNTLQSITNPQGFTRIGVATADNFLSDTYKKFYQAYQNAPAGKNFQNIFEKFVDDNGIPKDNIPNLQTYFYAKMKNDLSRQVLDPKDFASAGRITQELESVSDSNIKTVTNLIGNLAAKNNMLFFNEGGGKYTIQTRDGGFRVSVNNPTDAMKVVTKVGQISGMDLDGGNTGIFNPSVGSKGGFNQDFTPVTNKFADFLDRARTANPILNRLNPIVRWFDSVDSSTGQTQTLKPALDVQQAQTNKRALANTPEFIKLTELGKKAIDTGNSLSLTDRMVVGDVKQSANAEEIAQKLLARPMNAFEKAVGDSIKDENIKAVTDLMYNAKTLAGGKVIGSPEYLSALNQLGAKADPAVLKVAQGLVEKTSMSKDVFSPYAVIRYAQALGDPVNNVSRDVAAARANGGKGLTRLQQIHLDALDKYFEAAFTLGGIDPNAKLSGYLPHMQAGYALTKGDLPIPEEFAHELTRVGISDNQGLEGDTNNLVRIYHSGLLNHVSGFNEKLKVAEKAFSVQVAQLKQNALLAAKQNDKGRAKFYDKAANLIDSRYKQYLADSRGIPDVADQYSKAVRETSSRLGLNTPEPNSILQMYSLGSIAAVPALAFRDLIQTMGGAFVSYSTDFTNRMLTKTLSPGRLQFLRDEKIIPYFDAGDLVDPTSNVIGNSKVDSQSMAFKAIDKATEFAYKISGQEAVYSHMLAGAYTAAYDIAAEQLEKLKAGTIDKKEAYRNMDLHEHSPAVQKMFDDYVQQGKAHLAADFLGKWRGRSIVGYFGMANNPSGWNNSFGRFLGQYGTWGANATQTFMDQISRGDRTTVTGKIMRAGLWNGSLALAGGAAGFKVSNWYSSNPINILPGVGPVASLGSDLEDTYSKTNGNFDAVTKQVGGIGLDFVPYHRALSNWMDAYNTLNNGDLRGVGQAAGFKLSK